LFVINNIGNIKKVVKNDSHNFFTYILVLIDLIPH